MKKINTLLFLVIFYAYSACITQDSSGEIEELREELTAEINALKALLDQNSTISEIRVEENNLVLVFSDGSVISTPLPEHHVPVVGTNGNWHIGSVDLGVPAESEVPVIGANGNWWVGGQDTGVKFEVTDGQDGVDGQTPYIGSNGNWWIGSTDTGVPAQGQDGTNGTDGVDGTNGTDGVDGQTPYIGTNGNWWMGTTDTGVPAQGQDGTNGTDGVDGTNGTDGVDGTNGTDGVDGQTPFIGTNGNWWIGTTDTGVAAAGTDGAEGATPYIGTNGNWWIGTTDTGVLAQGTNGLDGNGIASVSYDQTTGILTIVLDDATSYEFLLSYEASLTGVKLSDLNGEFLLSAIYNGDVPFVTFDYNVDYRLQTIAYNTTVLNEPVEYLTIDRTYTVDGDIETQTFTEYATKKKAIQEGEVWPDKELGIKMTLADAFAEITGGTLDPSVESQLYSAMSTDGIFNDSLVYRVVNEYNETTELYEDVVRKYMVRNADATQEFGIVEVGPEGIYAWTTPYNETDGVWSGNYESIGAYDYDLSYYDFTGGNFVLGGYTTITYYPWGQPAQVSTVPVDNVDDTVTPDLIEDFSEMTDGTYENPGLLSGSYKTLFKRYSGYEPGEVIDSYTLQYSYGTPGGNFNVQTDIDGTFEDVVNVTVVNGQVTNVAVYNPDLAIPDFEDYLGFTYDGNGKLTNISVIKESAPDVVSISYDAEGNPIEFAVNPSLLQGDGDTGPDPEVLASLGLIYAYDEYDADLGMVVEKYHYPDAYTPMLSIKYDYTMKDFMNHTFMAANPLLSFFQNSNAIKQVSWSGHGSAIFSEYMDFNDGGYPTQIKAYLQVSASDVPIDMSAELEDFGIPINGSVAVTYNLEYIEKLP